MKKIFAFMLTVALACLPLIAYAPTANAAAAVSLVVTATPDTIVSGGTVDLNVSVTVGSGTSGQGIADVELYLEGGSTPIANWSRIGAGRSVQAVVSSLFIPPSQLNIPFPIVLKYKDFDGAEASVKGSFIVYEGVPAAQGEVRLTFLRTANVKSTTIGGLVTFTYSVRNDGAADVMDVEISDELTGKIATIPLLAPGQREEFIQSQRAYQDLVSTPAITYTNSATGERRTEAQESLTVPIANPKMTVSLKADVTQVKSGEMVSLNCTVFNEGNVIFYDVQISEETQGMMQGVATLEPGKSYVYSKKVVPVSSADYTFMVAAKDADGNSTTLKSNVVSIIVEDAPVGAVVNSDSLILSVACDNAQLTAPGSVNFTITVSNRSDKPVQELLLSEVSAGAIERMDRLPVGDKVFPYKVHVDSDKSFTFTVEGKTSDGQRVQGAPVVVEILMRQEASPTPIWATKEPTQEDENPIVPPSLQTPGYSTPGGGNGLLAALVVVGVLIVLCIAVLIILFARDRARRADYAQQRPVAYDDEPRYEYYEYEEPAYDERGEPDDEDEVTRPVAPRRRSSSQEDVRTRPIDPKRKR